MSSLILLLELLKRHQWGFESGEGGGMRTDSECFSLEIECSLLEKGHGSAGNGDGS